ncbi:MAG: VOC family protein [Chlamydiota bacterium]|nr:VOC family protein [Chlamydiota bacterium]
MKYKKMTPNFSVKNVKETVLFYRNILGFKLEMLVPHEEKVIEQNLDEEKTYNYAMMRKDEVFVMFLEENSLKEDMPLFKNMTQGTSLLLYIDVDHIDEVYNAMKDKVEIVKQFEKTWYGMKEFYIKDCNGFILGFGERIE